jgi:hypothetical protein
MFPKMKIFAARIKIRVENPNAAPTATQTTPFIGCNLEKPVCIPSK